VFAAHHQLRWPTIDIALRRTPAAEWTSSTVDPPLDVRLHSEMWKVTDAVLRGVLKDHTIQTLRCPACGYERRTSSREQCKSYAAAEETLRRRLQVWIGVNATHGTHAGPLPTP
jgi:hypothetical protein